MMEIDLRRVRETRAFQCLECGKCSGVCPVARYSHSFSPRSVLIKALRNTTPESLKAPDLWTCLTCQQCDLICPAGIKYIELTQLLRESADGQFDESSCSHGGILQTISKIMTSDAIQQDRLGWISDGLQTSKKSEYLYFTGCLPYYDPIFKETGAQPLEIAKSTLKILNYFDIKPQVLPNEKCCGHDFYWNGDMANFKKLAKANLDQFEKQGIRNIITSCPECYRTLKIEYPAVVGKVSYQVEHISEFMERLMEEKGIKIEGENKKVTYQDPCRLGRHLGIYEPPRKVMSHVNKLEFREMAHHHKRATCCGVSGWMNCSQVSKSIQQQRLQEATDTGADILVTACPKCQIHLSCAQHDKMESEHKMLEIKDLTQIVAERLQ